MHRFARSCAVAFMLALSAPMVSAADWPTARGNPQRTGNIDGTAGPKTPAVVWLYSSQDHFIASPSVGDKQLYVSGLGPFTTACFQALSLDDKAAQRVLWTMRSPALKLPVVCSPAVVGGRIIVGDGMHQTDGATLYCLRNDGVRPLWQLPVPGALVHLESAPTVADGRAYIGGGAAGVLCVDINRVTLDGAAIELDAAQAKIEAIWQERMVKYEAEKKKDPDFAVPPSEDSLPKALPKLVWQAGQGAWHVDSPMAVVGDRVFAASAKLDARDNFAGDCALFCLRVADGQVKWRTPLELNPWAGPTISGEIILVGCSTMRYDPKEIRTGKGQLVAMALDTGNIIWKKPVGGGIVSSVAASGGLAVFSATDGKVRAWNIRDGQEKWVYDAKAPFFAAPAVAGDLAYAADLKGVVHAIDIASGVGRWRLDLSADPAVRAPGMVFSSPVVHNGRLYVATCNQEAPDQQRTVVVCIGDKQ